MQVVIERTYRKPQYTIGRMYIDGIYFCNTLEDCDRGLRQDMPAAELQKMKVYGKTAIPTGKYKVTMTNSVKYGRIMPQIMNVKAFTGIRIHSGNTADDSLGCVLLGDNKERGKVLNSRARCREFEQRLIAAGSTAELEIKH